MPKPLAMLDEVTNVADSAAGSVRKVSTIRYVEDSEGVSNSATVVWHETSRLVQIFPGLAAELTTGKPDRHAIELLGLFGVSYQRELAQRVTAIGEVPIAWSWSGGQPDIRISSSPALPSLADEICGMVDASLAERSVRL